MPATSRIGIGRATVKRKLEELRATRRPSEQARYHEICAEVNALYPDSVNDPAALLSYLADIGTVFYRKGLFDDRVVLDQQWALEAIYAVFERRRGVYGQIRDRQQGRFTRADLARLLWDEMGHGTEEQALFLSMMEQCRICFQLKRGDSERHIEAEYIAPDMLSRLPACSSTCWRPGATIKTNWRPSTATICCRRACFAPHGRSRRGGRSRR